MRLRGKAALVTGAGSGFGEAIARRFAAEGARIAVNDVDAAKAEAVAAAIRQAGGEAVVAAGDVTNDDAVKAFTDKTVTAFGALDVLVMNAGVGMRPTPITDVGEDVYERIFATNVKSLYLGLRHAVPQFKKQGGGAVVITASTIALRPRAGLSLYAASKGAAISFAKAMALELAPYRVRVNAVCPSAGDTPMLKEFMGGVDSPEARKPFVARVPLGRLCEPADVAEAALFYADAAAAFVTGTIIEVDGGRSV